MHDNCCNVKIVWMAQIWAKWQIVIPKEARDVLWLQPWDNLVVAMKNNKFIGLIKNDDVNELIEYVHSVNWIVEKK